MEIRIYNWLWDLYTRENVSFEDDLNTATIIELYNQTQIKSIKS